MIMTTRNGEETVVIETRVENIIKLILKMNKKFNKFCLLLIFVNDIKNNVIELVLFLWLEISDEKIEVITR